MSLRTPQNTLQSMQNLLGACPQTPLHNPYYGHHFLYLPWAPPIPLALLTICCMLQFSVVMFIMECSHLVVSLNSFMSSIEITSRMHKCINTYTNISMQQKRTSHGKMFLTKLDRVPLVTAMHGMINILKNMFTIYHSSGITYASITR